MSLDNKTASSCHNLHGNNCARRKMCKIISRLFRSAKKKTETLDIVKRLRNDMLVHYDIPSLKRTSRTWQLTLVSPQTIEWRNFFKTPGNFCCFFKPTPFFGVSDLMDSSCFNLPFLPLLKTKIYVIHVFDKYYIHNVIQIRRRLNNNSSYYLIGTRGVNGYKSVFHNLVISKFFKRK